MAKSANIAALIVAGGSGKRLGNPLPKQYMKLSGQEVLRHTIQAFLKNKHITHVQVVIAKGHEKLYRKAIQGLDLPAPVIGGNTRQQSVMNGLAALKKTSPDKVLIHDAARPFVSDEMINKIISSLKSHLAAIPVIQISDTVKRTEKSLVTVDKSKLVRAQTPQGFDYTSILAAHKKAAGKNLTDDAAIAEYSGMKVATVQGSASNFKITEKDDMALAQSLIGGGQPRIGMGFDVHAFGPQKSSKNFIMVCGIKIPYERKLLGHSDADVGLHAIVDAVLGSLGQGDIGEHFPPSDKKWRGADSSIFAHHAASLLEKESWKINNLDVTIICEEPKITPHKIFMRKKLSGIFGIPYDKINIKATTTEGLGFTGRKEGVAAQAVVSITNF